MNTIDLKGRKAIVTGGARGIGYAIAERLLVSGSAVSLWDLDGEALEAAARALARVGEVHHAVVDVTKASAVQTQTEATLRRFGTIDILVNNAGIAGPNKKSWEYAPEEWQTVLMVDLTGVFLCCRAVVPGMIANGYGRIVNVASIAGKEGNPNASAYSAAKAGVIALTKSLGKELAQTGVLVNCVTPAAVATDIFKQMSQEHIQYMLAKIPMGRFGRTTEVAAMVAWLCSDECSFTTGGVFDLSGGRATY
ncbi:MAG: SDR family NAD(P)-dependent oxidoreductase [Candidatus Methylomirabilia bacterium]